MRCDDKEYLADRRADLVVQLDQRLSLHIDTKTAPRWRDILQHFIIIFMHSNELT